MDIIYVMVLFIFFMMIVSSPILMILVLIFVLFFMIIAVSFILNSYFYSYVIFLLFISGLMILVMYVGSVVVSEKFMLSINFYWFWVMIFLFCFSIGNYELELINLQNNTIYLYVEFISLIKFFIYSFSFLSGVFFLYLLMCLFIVYEIVKKVRGPLRMKF